jgi:DNA invertase Pin-like site-specific DNA recombinase
VDTTTPAGKAMFQMMGGAFAEFDRSIVQERTRAGLKRAKDEGKLLVRRTAWALEERIQEALRTTDRPFVP